MRFTLLPRHGGAGAEECALETCSFSKYAGFTGTRLGWTVVPDALRFADGSKVQDAFVRVTSTVFNGASNLSQAGGIACLEVCSPLPHPPSTPYVREYA